MRRFYVYILSNRFHTVFYVGVTNSLERRLEEHRTKRNLGFTSKYNIHKLLYYETFDNVRRAIRREKQIKGYRRDKKIKLINLMNPGWEDLGVV